MTAYPGSDRARPTPSDDRALIREASWRTERSALQSSPQAAVDLREAHLARRLALIRGLGYPQMRLLSGS